MRHTMKFLKVRRTLTSQELNQQFHRPNQGTIFADTRVAGMEIDGENDHTVFSVIALLMDEINQLKGEVAFLKRTRQGQGHGFDNYRT